jgi:hypothetical protein
LFYMYICILGELNPVYTPPENLFLLPFLVELFNKVFHNLIKIRSLHLFSIFYRMFINYTATFNYHNTKRHRYTLYVYWQVKAKNKSRSHRKSVVWPCYSF